MKKTTSAKPVKRASSRLKVNVPRRPATKVKPRALRPCPVVGIGASAGGLEALLQFLEQVPVDSGMAYVIVQHLDPTQKGMMPELLQRATTMKVRQVKDRTRVRPDCVYVIPPNHDLSLLHGVLHLLTPTAARGLRLPIDFFFRSLAEDQREQSIGIILSGMGSDGTLGLRAIKEKAGLVLVQDPTTAKFEPMPRSAIEAGLADFVASAQELPGKLISYRQHLPKIGRNIEVVEGKTRGAMEKIVLLLRAHTGHDFSLYRHNTLHRRIERRMGIHQLVRISAYVRFLQANPQEVGILFKELLIGVTSFFRDPGAWKQLAKHALIPLLNQRPASGTLRAWVPGCSTGEEAYTLAMAFLETRTLDKRAANISLQIYATDLDKDAIDKARQGFFLPNIAADVSAARLKRFFIKEPNGYRVNKEVRAMVVFAVQNLIMDPPFTKLDLLCCRNLLIYLTPELQSKLFPLFYYSLHPGGVLFLGSAESTGSFSNLFIPLAARERIFQRKETVSSVSQLNFPAVFAPVKTGRSNLPSPAQPGPSLQALAEKLLQSSFTPPAVLVNDQGDILYLSGRTSPYLEPPAGKANWNVMAMAREEIRYELTRAFQQVHRKGGTINVPGLRLDNRSVDLTVQLLDEPKELKGMSLIVFAESVAPAPVPAPKRNVKNPPPGRKHLEMERELHRAREELRASREEMQISQEELRSVNEELQSTNEELQSTNEELTTSKEEMQSLNEELQTVNAELQTKLDELSASNNDMKNLLNSTDIATVFLDNELCVRRFTLQAKTIIKLIPGDVGRPITDLASDLLYPGLVEDAHEVLRTLVFTERTIATGDGRWFSVRVMPYRTTDNRIDGVVITFANITAAKKVEAGLRKEQARLVNRSVAQDHALAQALQPAQAATARPRPVRNKAREK
jgi:chemotaxis methyl-accepting protein methylase